MTELRAILYLPLLLALTGCGSGGSGVIGSHFQDVAVVAGLSSPTALAFAADGRMFLCEKAGTVRVVKPGGLAPAFALQLDVTTDHERGLVGVALDPQFASNNFVYLYYTSGPSSLNAPSTPKNRVSRFTAAGDSLQSSSENIVIDNIPSETGIHNGGCLRFGPDGKLYASVGDSGFSANAQDLNSLAGKILRVNRDGTIPADNPFANQAGKRGEIYCFGLRNPFRFSFRPGSGALYIADVGQNTWEEVNIGLAGGNYGWPLVEGPGSAGGSIAPLYTYNHNGAGASITGGAFATGSNYPVEYQNSYFFADFIQNSMVRLNVNADNSAATALDFGPSEGLAPLFTSVTDVEQGTDGDIYYLTFDGSLRHIRCL